MCQLPRDRLDFRLELQDIQYKSHLPWSISYIHILYKHMFKKYSKMGYMNVFGSNKLHCRSFMRHHRAPQSRRALPIWSDACCLASLRVAVHGRQNHPKAHQKCFFVKINPMVYHNFLYQNWNLRIFNKSIPQFRAPFDRESWEKKCWALNQTWCIWMFLEVSWPYFLSPCFEEMKRVHRMVGLYSLFDVV